ncbi:MAG TPA: ankyrin repeat domain-containing protein [Thermoanaerobaculia bacterium]|nr:ankyrin repeat domain-containing protein [Thermoanaerobaculia bacterium]
MRLLVRVALVLLLATPLSAAKPKLPPLQPMLDRAEAAVLAGTYDIQRDLAPLLERLATTRDPDEQDDLLDTIETLGGYDAIMPAAVKAYFREAAPPAILSVIRGNAPGSVRTDALMLLRTLNVDVPVLDEAIAIATADTSADQRAVKFRAELLQQWKSNRPANETATPSKNEQAALEYLRSRRTRISAYSLGIAAMNADTGLVEALLDAGVPVDARQIAGTPLGYATGSGCATAPDAPGRIATVELLISRGADVKWTDGNDNTLLMFALDCPAEVVAKLLDAGASLDAVNAMQYNALQLALAKGKWDVAALLVARGARLTTKQIDDLFFEKPDDPEKLALLKRATKK